MSLFEPIEVGDIDLRHRIVVPPLQNDIVVPNELNAEWYTQRVEVPGTLLIVRLNIPNVDGATKNNDEINHWKDVVEKVHQLRSFIYLQLWLSDEYTFDQGIKKISTKNIGEIVRGYVQAASTAIEVGFDGVEIGGEDKTLLHLFFEDSNNRKDAYGSIIENKVRLLNEVVDALSKSIGRSKVGVSLSPWERSYSYGPIPIYSYFLALQELNQKRGRGIAYIRLVKPGIRASNWDFVRKVWSGVLIRDENLSPEAGSKALAVDPNALIAFREYFLSNPHLVKSIKPHPLSAEYDSDAIDIRNHLDQNLPNSSYTSQADTERLDESKSNHRKKNLILNAFVMSTPNHLSPGMWRDPSSETSDYNKSSYWIKLARLLERGKFHAVFIADSLGPSDVYRGPGNVDPAVATGTQFPVGDPSLSISAMASVTKHLAFGVTTSTTYEHPYTVARRFSTLDHLTDGRIGWNIVTSVLDSAAYMFGLHTQIDHDERYVKAEEFLEVCYKLWESSWKDDAILRDKEHGVFADVKKVKPIHHESKYYKVDGVHIHEPSPQRTPLLFQAGTSRKGSSFGTKHSELIFIRGFNPEKTAETVASLRKQAVEQGRGAYQIKIVASVVVTLAETDAKAREKYEEYLSYADIEGALTLFGGWTGYDLSQYGDNDDFRFEGPPAIQSTLLDINNSRKWTKSDIARELVLGGFSRKLIGSPKTVADRLERWALESDLDGFNFAHITSPGTYEDIVDLLIPELQQRGLFHYDYANTSTARGQVFGHDHLPSDHPGYQYKYDD